MVLKDSTDTIKVRSNSGPRLIIKVGALYLTQSC